LDPHAPKLAVNVDECDSLDASTWQALARALPLAEGSKWSFARIEELETGAAEAIRTLVVKISQMADPASVQMHIGPWELTLGREVTLRQSGPGDIVPLLDVLAPVARYVSRVFLDRPTPYHAFFIAWKDCDGPPDRMQVTDYAKRSGWIHKFCADVIQWQGGYDSRCKHEIAMESAVAMLRYGQPIYITVIPRKLKIIVVKLETVGPLGSIEWKGKSYVIPPRVILGVFRFGTYWLYEAAVTEGGGVIMHRVSHMGTPAVSSEWGPKPTQCFHVAYHNAFGKYMLGAYCVPNMFGIYTSVLQDLFVVACGKMPSSKDAVLEHFELPMKGIMSHPVVAANRDDILPQIQEKPTSARKRRKVVHRWVRIVDIVRVGEYFDLRVEWESGIVSDHSMIKFSQDCPDGVRAFLNGQVPPGSREVAEAAMCDPNIRRMLKLTEV
jgi:hypothetical protein